MSVSDPCLIRSRGPSGEPTVRLGMPWVDDYLEFLEGRCRPNTVLAAAYDLRVFFGVVAKPPADVAPADVLGAITGRRDAVLCSPSAAPMSRSRSRQARWPGGCRPSRGLWLLGVFSSMSPPD